MIRFALQLIRSSMLSVAVLACALTTLVNVLSSDPGDDAAATASTMPSLAPLPKVAAPAGTAAAALRVALFDPERRPETVAGSIDDLRLGPAPPPPAADVALSGVMVADGKRRAMLSVAGGRSGWTEVGTEVGGWRVAAVDADGALLERDGQTLTLKIVDRLKTRSRPRGDAPAGGPGPETPPPADGAGPPTDGGGPTPYNPPDAVDPSRPAPAQ